jgi:hypothetical protein
MVRAQQGDRVRRIGVLMAGDENDPHQKHRLSAALAAAKRRGVRLGGFRAGAKLTAKARQAGYAARAALAAAKATGR